TGAGPRSIPGFGLLADEFPAPALKLWTLPGAEGGAGRAYAWFDEARGIRVPLRPTGGNIDTRHVTAGATLFLPVEVEGALFSIGDGHAAQGDGEVCGTAIETPMKVTVRLTVVQDTPYVQTPHFATPSAGSPADSGGCYCTTGVDPDIREATRAAVRGMIAYLGATHGLSRTDAYMLCSVAGDLRMHEVVPSHGRLFARAGGGASVQAR
ncbi:hypothetical protein POSPLADRAFT_1055895, partial [Postia placenta MAD-698-R-SB12]